MKLTGNPRAPKHCVLSTAVTLALAAGAMPVLAAEYSNGDDVDPVKLTFADECHTKFVQLQARLASKPPSVRKRRLPATCNATQPPTARISRPRRTTLETK